VSLDELAEHLSELAPEALAVVLAPLVTRALAAAFSHAPAPAKELPEYLTVQEVTTSLKVSRDACYKARWLEGARVRLGGSVRFDKRKLRGILAHRPR
jgi:hypothetical protein